MTQLSPKTISIVDEEITIDAAVLGALPWSNVTAGSTAWARCCE
jgi:hypothetical protein